MQPTTQMSLEINKTTHDFVNFAESQVTQKHIAMQTETLKNKTDSNHSNEISSEITIKAIEDVV